MTFRSLCCFRVLSNPFIRPNARLIPRSLFSSTCAPRIHSNTPTKSSLEDQPKILPLNIEASISPAEDEVSPKDDLEKKDNDKEIESIFKESPYVSLGLRKDVINAIEHTLGWKYPTKIQKEMIPLTLSGKNVVASAWTGQGKTGAFMIPIIQQLLDMPSASESDLRKQETNDRADLRYVRPKVVILAPSSELARQIAQQFTAFGQPLGITTHLFINDKTLNEQLCDLPSTTDVIVSTPGRLFQHLQYAQAQQENNYGDYKGTLPPLKNSKSVLSMTRLHNFVVDECDKLLSLGFLPDVQKTWLLASQPVKSDRSGKIQVIVCSATLVREIHGLVIDIAPHHKLIDLNRNQSIPKAVKQIRYDVTSQRKFSLLLYLLKRKGKVSLKGKKVLVFTRTIQRCDRLVEKFSENVAVMALHSEITPARRQKAIMGIQEGKIQMIVATDLASRGLDLPELDIVVNYDLPDVTEDYVHRVGRVGRAGRTGLAISLVAKDVEVIRRPNAPNTTRDEQIIMQRIEALLEGSSADANASKLETRKIPGPFLDVEKYSMIKSIADDVRYRDLLNNTNLEIQKSTPVNTNRLNTKKKNERAKENSNPPAKEYSELMREFATREAKSKGVVLSDRDRKANLHKQRRSK